MESIDRRVLLAGAGLAGVAALTRAAKAGPLTPPPGPVSSTGKTLQQVYDKIARGGDAGTPEARIPIQGLPGSSTALHVIDAPGSYYLAGNVIGVPGKSAIEILADDVEIECDGYNFLGVQGTRACISTPSPRRCIGVYDGGFQNWHGCSINLSNSFDCLVEECWFNSCVGESPDPTSPPATCALGDGGVVYDCDVRKCFGGMVRVGRRGIIEECVCSESSVLGACFFSPGDCVMEDNFAQQCDATAFVVGERGVVLYNRVVDCPGGVDVGQASVVEDNDIDVTAGSTGNGITIRGTRCCVSANYVAGGGGGGGGIVVYQGGDGALIEDNHVAGAASGVGTTGGGLIWIQPGVTRCHVVCNRVRGNSVSSSFYVPPGNSFGPYAVVAQGGDLSLSAASSHPQCNFIC
jgi:hypothetical protein